MKMGEWSPVPRRLSYTGYRWNLSHSQVLWPNQYVWQSLTMTKITRNTPC